MKPAELQAIYKQVNNVSLLPDDEQKQGLIRACHETIEARVRSEKTRLCLFQILYATSTFVGS